MRSAVIGCTLWAIKQRYHVLVEGGLSLTAPQREDGGWRQGPEVPQRQGWTAATQLQAQHAVRDQQQPSDLTNRSFLPSSPSQSPSS